MSYEIYSNKIATISELRKNPMAIISEIQDEPIVILSHNKPICYCIVPSVYEAMIDMIDDIELINLIKEREGEESIRVNINDL